MMFTAIEWGFLAQPFSLIFWSGPQELRDKSNVNTRETAFGQQKSFDS